VGNAIAEHPLAEALRQRLELRQFSRQKAQAERGGDEVDRYQPRGAAAELFDATDPEVLIVGPAGTGKSRGCFERIHSLLQLYPRARALVVRKTLASLTASGLVTFREKVLQERDHVHFFGGSSDRPPQYEYPNGSVLVVGGMDKAEKVLSTEYDMIYGQEATELEVHDHEMLTGRLRNGVLPFQQLIEDCNPGAPSHWLLQRAKDGKIRMLLSRHQDNPVYWDEQQDDWTAEGRRYVLGVLENLTGVRLERLRFGRWAAAEGVVYEGWDASVHCVQRFDIPDDWPRFWSIDFGFTNPFVCQWWAQDPDGRLYRYREIYRTQRLVEDHAIDALTAVAPFDAGGLPAQYVDGRWTGIWQEPKPRAVICDHDAEGRGTWERRTRLATLPAKKTVTDGIQAVASRLKPAGDGRPRLFYLRDSLVERDPELAVGMPGCTEEEYDSYIWDLSNNRKKGEEPVKKHDHGMDGTRYLVAQFDLNQASRGAWL
jgi:Phage terminase large subunit